MVAGRAGRRRMRWLLAISLLLPAIARAQPALPPPQLPDEEPVIEEEPEPPRPAFLPSVRGGQIDDPLAVDEDDDAEPPLPRDVPGETSGMGSVDQPVMGEAERAEGYRPAPFSIAAGVGFARLIAVATDMVSIHQRFEARLPEFPALVLGVGVSEMIGSNWFVAGGPRIGLGAVMFDAVHVACEAVVSVQLGVAGGDLGVYFDLSGTVDLRLLLFRTIEVGVSGGIHFLGNATIAEVGGLVGIPFG